MQVDKSRIKALLKSVLRDKFHNYQPETIAMPFHTRLLGKDRLALYSFIHSLNTNFGTTIFEPLAIILGQDNFTKCEKQFYPNKVISSEAQKEIQSIMDNLNMALTAPNKQEEISRIRAVCQKGSMHSIKTTRVDIMLESAHGEQYFVD